MTAATSQGPAARLVAGRRKRPPTPAAAHGLKALPWPLPALLAWVLAWALLWAARLVGCSALPAFLLALVAGTALAFTARGLWRRALVAGGFPLSALALGAAAAVPAWAWLLAAMPLLLAYPLRAWRDAPFFPTPLAALQGLQAVAPLADGARVLDAGCGLGHGLTALRGQYPAAAVEGVEWSRPLAWLAARRCGFARVQRGDMWAGSWQRFHLVYVFQRPESMARVWSKACADMHPGSWLVSLEFEVTGAHAHARAGTAGGRPVWVYRVPGPGDGPEPAGAAASHAGSALTKPHSTTAKRRR